MSDTEIWNKGVDAYNKGDFTNAYAILQPLMLNREYGARASEVVGAIDHKKSKENLGADLEKSLESAELAANAMQNTYRSNPEDPRVKRNFARAVDGIHSMRENAHIQKVLKENANASPDSIVASAVGEIRKITEEQKSVFTNEPAIVISRSEDLAKRMEKLSDAWIVLKEAIAKSVTNEQQLAAIVGEVESARDITKNAVEKLNDLSPDADMDLISGEEKFYNFHKMLILPPAAIDEGILAQTNAFADVDTINSRPWQKEALDFTQVFRAKFPQWAQMYEAQAQSDTNMPPFKKEDQAKISALALEVEKKQLELVKHELPQNQLECVKLLEEIRNLLPKNNNQNNQNNQDQQNQNKDQNQNQNQDQNKNQDQQNENQNQNEENKNEEKVKKMESQESKEDLKDMKDVDKLLRKALERSDEHERDKKERLRKAPLRPNERDW